jgi:hypothetical protein
VQFGDLMANPDYDSKSIYIPTQERGNELCCEPYVEEMESKTVVLEIENWPSHKSNGVVIKFMILSI